MRAIVALLLLLATLGASPSSRQWILINDIHLNPFDQSTTPIRGGDTNRALWRVVLAELRLQKSPDVVVLGGDMLAHHFDALARKHRVNPQTAALATIREIATTLRTTFPRAQFLVALGNNDDPCGDYRSETGGAYQKALAAIWKPLVDHNGAAPDFTAAFVRGGYYSARLPDIGGRALVLNSVLWSFVYRGGCWSSTRGAGIAELRWLDSALERTPRAVLVMHMPPGFDPLSTTTAHRFLAVPFLSGTADSTLMRIFARDARHIDFALAAHTHRYDFRAANGVGVLIGSSVSPVYNNNPAFYDLSVAPSGRLLNVVPIVYDLYEGTWNDEPSFDALYDVRDLRAQNLRGVSDRIAQSAQLRASWIRAYDVWSYRMGDISDHSWRVYQCAQLFMGAGYAACAGTQHRTAWLTGALALAAAVVVVLLALLVRRLSGRSSRRGAQDR